VATSKELVKQAVQFRGPERIPLSYPYDLTVSDIVSVEVVRNFAGPKKTLSEWGFEWEIFKPRYRRQIDLAHQCGLDVYFHCCGYIYDILPDFVEIDLDIFNPGQPNINGIRRMGQNFSGKMCFACPVSYQTTGISGTKEQIYRETRELVDCLGNYNGGLIGVIPSNVVGLGAKPENVTYMLDAFRTFYKK
jgi:hypothetical protein